MQTLTLIILFSVSAAVLFAIFYFKPDLPKKVWGYIAAGVIAMAGFFFLVGRRKTTTPEDPELRKKEDKLREDLRIVHEEAEEKIREAAEKEEEVRKEVEDIKRIEDEEERLKLLASLFNRTRRSK